MLTFHGPDLPASSALATALQEASAKARSMIAAVIEEMVCAWIVETGQGCVVITTSGIEPVEVALDYAALDLTAEQRSHAAEIAKRWEQRTPLRATESMVRYGFRDLVFYVEVVPFERE